MSGRFKSKRGCFRGGYSKKRVSPDDDDAAPRVSKKAKATVEEDEDSEDNEEIPFVPKLQKDERGDYYVGVRKNCYIRNAMR